MADYSYLAFLPIVVGVLAFAIWQRRRLAGAVAANRDKDVGSVALRLGLSVVEGDAGTNLLYFQTPATDFTRRIRATGQPYGRPVEFVVVDGRTTDEYVVARRITTTFGCFLEATTSFALPAFEVVLRQPNPYLVANPSFAERADLREASTGHPQLDATFVVRAADPRVAPVLAGALSVLGSQLFVHLAGEGQRIWISITRMGLPYFSMAPEEYLLALESAACGMEGRPAPARRGPPVVA